MIRLVFAVIGLLEALFPRKLIDFFEPVAFENADAGELRATTVPIARLEGVVFTIAALRRRGSSSLLWGLLGTVGLTAALAPERYLQTGLRMAYRNPEELTVRSWVVPLTKAVGALYVVAALRGLLVRGGEAAADDADAEGAA
ncbi:MAG: hypothetical protein ABEJ31_05815 [Haloarculaceae archaeon]